MYAIADIVLAADDLNFFANHDGTYLKDGDLVELGQFSISDAQISGLVTNGWLTPTGFATLISNFIPLNGTFSNPIGAGTSLNASDKNSGAISAVFTGSNPTFANGPIYAMVFNSNTAAQSSELGVFRGDSTWTFPPNMNSGGAILDTDNALTTPLVGTFVGSLSGANNPYNNNDGNQNATVGQLRLVGILIPEPSTYLLVGTGLLGLLGLHRRRS